MSTTTSARPPAVGRALPWICVAVMVLCVAALPVLGQRGPTWSVWVVAAAALVLPVVAAALLSRAARREEEAFRALVIERDGLAAGLAEASRALEDAHADRQRTQDERADERAAVETAVVALSRKVQASAHRVQEEATRMAQRHAADHDVLETSMRIDHAAAQHARQAQSLVALCGRRPGQTWDAPLALPDVVRAAAGRITAYGRVEVSGDPGLAVTGRAVEPLVHVVAELLANATQCSPPNTQVLVVIRQVQRGAVVEIDDCGVGMDPRELARVRRIAAGEDPVTISDLGEVPQTGLAVVGTYARFLGLHVELTDSVYGGLRAVVRIPGEITETAAGVPDTLAAGVEEASPVPAPTGAEPRDPLTAPVPAPAVDPASGPPALPQRRSRRAAMDRTPTAGHGTPRVPEPSAGLSEPRRPEQTAEEAGAWIGAFFAATDPAPPHDPDTHDPSVGTGPRRTDDDADQR
ncbi:ATP-binding protein [Isoptericola sp. AK164]|uniref:ATP-binding protein n=1 Tax=Isoptericola sp. AK164 TaxID=3024246 RepID=UPI002418549B|nr:ATP-binding protein [Isoptericola sp. AK164]